MDFNRICYNCMKEKDRANWICPHCGFDNSIYGWQENELPPLTPLNGKYLVGRALELAVLESLILHLTLIFRSQ